ncbi:acyl-CoA dehydrogenase [Nocardia sp. NPDC050412]|uniref:acyl-CoA dehydrogenase n=1 Tax=Nocardia sp. NPDC050412 TaxID=3364320 RepID=UPI0037A9649B
MGHYRSNVRDIEFNLFEVLGVGKLLDEGHYGEIDASTARAMLQEAARLAEGPIAESFASADRHPVGFDSETHEIVLTMSLRRSVMALKSSGWSLLGLPEAIGGQRAPMAMVWAVREMLYVANPAVCFYDMGPAMAGVLFDLGTPQQQHWAARSQERGWAATMVLTEPDAGSDVGAGRTKATDQGDGTWHIEGVKRFISGGDVGDTAENLFHLVLARPEGAGPGTKGLSLFFVPKYHFDPVTLELGERNGVYVTGVEDKMGIKSSPTCEVSFGANGSPAVGWLVGDKHNGIAQMFRVLENARMMVGVKAAGTLSTAYLSALDYAKERIQGADLTRATDSAAPRVPITRHPEVRRMLLTQKAYTEGLRSLYMFTAAYQDPIPTLAQRLSGADPTLARSVNDFLLPVVKGFGSERGYDTLKLSLQTLGGSGYLRDYPFEQYIRDTMIDTLYEGTTPIQAQDFFFRKIIRDHGRAFEHVLTLVEDFATFGHPDDSLFGERQLLAIATTEVRDMAKALAGYLVVAQTEPSEIYKVGAGAVRFLYAVGDLLVAWRLLVQADVACGALHKDNVSEEEASFYRGKIAVASFFAKNVLPELNATRAILTALDNDVMTIEESEF